MRVSPEKIATITLKSITRSLTLAIVSICWFDAIQGCVAATATTPSAATAPGYNNSTDQTLGETLAGISAFVSTESTVNYPAETTAQQAVEKPYLNALITLTNSANAIYLQYHAGTATIAQVQTAVSAAQTAQTNLTNAKGISHP